MTETHTPYETHAKVTLIAVTAPLQHRTLTELVEHAGRVCTHTAPGDAPEFVAARIAQGHESLLEHVSFTFELCGVSRVLTHQLVRHRLASYSQESQRAVVYDGEAVVPPSLADNPAALAAWEHHVERSGTLYHQLVATGIPLEDARYCLPGAAPTRLVVTMNLRELRHFLRLRLSPHAQWEIRAVARAMRNLARPYLPAAFEED
jgi:thymidylate synthase (FAD)